MKPKIEMDTCGLKTQWPGDDHCIKAPPPDKGFQMHVGPTDHANPEATYVLQPGAEFVEDVSVKAGNTADVYYYWRQYRLRPGSHHLIIYQGSTNRRLGGSSNAAKDNPEAGVIAPENQGVGMPLSAGETLRNNMHWFNFSDKKMIKEVWVNFWYRDQADVTTPTKEIFSMLGMGIAPGQHVIKAGTCNVTGSGRLLTLYGHVHAHNKRFSAWHIRGGQKTLIHEAFDWEHPNISEFSSTVMNPVSNAASKTDGGYTGALELKNGDQLYFECDILNDTQTMFVGLNEAQDDEMCIMIGDSVGATVSGLCQSATMSVQ